MTTAVSPAPSSTPGAARAGRDGAVAGRPGQRRETRGTTTIADRVIERIAVHIVAGEDGVGGAARRVWGVAVGPESAERKAAVEVTVSGDVVSLLVRLSVTYPAPVGAAADQVRRHLRDRVAALTGKTVEQVDIVVVALHRRTGSPRRVR